jgi:hypothetical protein
MILPPTRLRDFASETLAAAVLVAAGAVDSALELVTGSTKPPLPSTDWPCRTCGARRGEPCRAGCAAMASWPRCPDTTQIPPVAAGPGILDGDSNKPGLPTGESSSQGELGRTAVAGGDSWDGSHPPPKGPNEGPRRAMMSACVACNRTGWRAGKWTAERVLCPVCRGSNAPLLPPALDLENRPENETSLGKYNQPRISQPAPVLESGSAEASVIDGALKAIWRVAETLPAEVSPRAVSTLLIAVEQIRMALASANACWHCKVSLVPEGLPHCDSCPVECDGCEAEGCVGQLAKNDAVCPSNKARQ